MGCLILGGWDYSNQQMISFLGFPSFEVRPYILVILHQVRVSENEVSAEKNP